MPRRTALVERPESGRSRAATRSGARPRQLRSAPHICGDNETTRTRTSREGSASDRAALSLIAPQSTTWSTGRQRIADHAPERDSLQEHHLPACRRRLGQQPACGPAADGFSARSAAGVCTTDRCRHRRWRGGRAGPTCSSAPWRRHHQERGVGEGTHRVPDQAMAPELRRHQAGRRIQLRAPPGHDVQCSGHAPDPPLPGGRQRLGGGIDGTGPRLVRHAITLLDDVEGGPEVVGGDIGRNRAPAALRTAANSPTRPIVVPRRSSWRLSHDSNLQ